MTTNLTFSSLLTFSVRQTHAKQKQKAELKQRQKLPLHPLHSEEQNQHHVQNQNSMYILDLLQYAYTEQSNSSSIPLLSLSTIRHLKQQKEQSNQVSGSLRKSSVLPERVKQNASASTVDLKELNQVEGSPSLCSVLPSIIPDSTKSTQSYNKQELQHEPQSSSSAQEESIESFNSILRSSDGHTGIAPVIFS
jgi:hypothetical protein